MGCCFSQPSGPNSPYPGGAPNSSARAINPPPLTLPEGAHSTRPDTASSSRHHHQQQQQQRRREQAPLDQHLNKPLKRHSWTAKDRRWTRRELAKERADFFDTRVTGRSEIWQTLHAALQQLWDTQRGVHADADAGDEALATAQTILEAAEISVPTGNLAKGAYDTLGNYYQLPAWVVSDPKNVQDDDADDDDKGGEDAKGHLRPRPTDGDGLDEDDDDDDDEEDAESRRAEKGKAVVDMREQIYVRARLSESGRDYQVMIAKTDNVRTLARRIAAESGLASTKKIRLAYMGKILKETASLESQGWQHGHIVNALVFPA